MYGYIYETTNIINNKKYIGKRVSNKYDNKYLGSGILLKKAVEKYGKENFSQVILQECYSKEELNKAEIYWIKNRNATKSKDYYNIASGGEGGNLVDGYSDEQIKIRNKLISERTKQRMLELGIINKTGLSDEYKLKISKATKGIQKSEEMKRKLSEKTKGVPKPWLRKPKSLETRNKMSISASKRKRDKKGHFIKGGDDVCQV